MRIMFTEESWEDYLYWQRTDRKMVARINMLLREITRNPFTGPGKPEPLRHKYKGYWSRRIDGEHRLIYKAIDNQIHVAKCRFHYDG
jgi:toxin YoeB